MRKHHNISNKSQTTTITTAKKCCTNFHLCELLLLDTFGCFSVIGLLVLVCSMRELLKIGKPERHRERERERTGERSLLAKKVQKQKKSNRDKKNMFL